jgi:hypothetical protein
MARRRSHPPRARKGRNGDSVAPPKNDVALAVGPSDSVGELASEMSAPAPTDEMAALDAGWDDIGS